MKRGVRERRIALIGPYASGKTVLLTSLINHIREHEHNASLFPLFKARVGRWKCVARIADWLSHACITNVQEERCDDGWTKFPYKACRDALAEGEWPDKSADRFQYVCRYTLNGRWRSKHCRLKMYDVPGERLADAKMFTLDYAGWSEWVLERLETTAKLRRLSKDFLELQQPGSSVSPERLVKAYLEVLARMIKECDPYVTPSTVLFGTDGTQPRPEDVERCALARSCGLPGGEFTPLSPDLRKRNPALHSHFEGAYASYKEQVVAPVFAALRECNGLCACVDVLDTLRGGPSKANGTHEILEDTFDVIRECAPRLKRAALVATMADRAVEDERERLATLAEELIAPKDKRLDRCRVRVFYCAAVCSTTTNGDHQLAGYWRGPPSPGEKRTDQEVSEVPRHWPRGRWDGCQFRFPRPFPDVSQVNRHAPDHVKLNDVFRFLTA